MRFPSPSASRCLALASHIRYPAFNQLPFTYRNFSVLPSNMATNGTHTNSGLPLKDLPKSWTLPSLLPPDPLYPTPRDSHNTPRDEITPRQVRGGLFTYVRPERQQSYELLAISPAAFKTLNLSLSEAETPDFQETVVGNKLWEFDETDDKSRNYPWSQNYGGFQFGSWAGQLGDGRVISLFETINSQTGKRYEVQLKGAGMTPYSRFADGKAVLRSSIREFVVSEALHGLQIPTTRALALTLLPKERVRRERIEPGAIVVRFAETWIRLGNFDLLRARGERANMRTLADVVAEHVYKGWENLPARLQEGEKEPKRGVKKEAVEGPKDEEQNRYARLYREIVRRNAATVARWQAYGFMNGVLNTDNTSIFGLSMDFGPFAFMDVFDPSYTPNHDDHMLRYSYRNQPTIIWWNLVRLGEALGEMMGIGDKVDDKEYIEKGVVGEEMEKEMVGRAEKIIEQAGEEYKGVFLAEYKRLMSERLGLVGVKEDDFGGLFSPLLDAMEALQLDFNLFFRRLSSVKLANLETEEGRTRQAKVFFYHDGLNETSSDDLEKVADWLAFWKERIVEDWGEGKDEERIKAMKAVNPNFTPRGWIMDEIIRRVEKEGEREVLKRVMHMATYPFEDSWSGREFDGVVYEGDAAEEKRWTGDVPRSGRAMQCSCSS
ncbi:hypothetical protein QBC36DRAFT_378929 [Triangularia setosa]|uniref:Selenoprotein O n=1 Tax=Triangularia setosa TaxID=2587417 RepID=A0AAN6W6L2_9PEZI|nr:hypothetical protein QBC36DRAFT_378929 [Podospora setosa]